MNFPRNILKEGKIYNLIKEYKYYSLYEEEKTKTKECFSKYDLNMINKMVMLERYLRRE